MVKAPEASLPKIAELERRLNRSLSTKLPKDLFRKSRRIAIDLTLIPYHGQPYQDEKEIYRSTPESGTTHFHAYATPAVVHNYTLALLHVEYGEKMKGVVQKLLKIIRGHGVKVRYLLLDKGLCHQEILVSVEVISYLKRAGVGFIIPAMARGRKSKGRKKATGLRAIRKKKNGDGMAHAQGQGERQASQHSGDHLCGEQKIYTQKDRQA